MRVERIKEIMALVSVLSVVVASLPVAFLFDASHSSVSLLTVAASGALVAAVSSVYLSRMLAQRRRARHVFIIYDRADVEVARRLAEMLKNAGLDPWLDVDRLLPGQLWRQTTLTALEESGAAAVILSNNSEKSKFMLEELAAARKLLQSRDESISPIVPIRIDDSPFLQHSPKVSGLIFGSPMPSIVCLRGWHV